VNIGGQAVIEGVMIRNRYIYSIAVRKQDGTVDVVKKEISSPAQRIKLLGRPFVRGITALVENLVLGIKSLLYSAEVALPENEKNDGKEKKKRDSGILVFLGVIPAFALGIVLFMIIPNLSTHYMGIIEEKSPFIFNIVAGLIRITVFLFYIIFISMFKEIRRTFQYHGAEHKSIYCYEAGKPLTVEEASKFKTMHPRCGTSFLFFVLFITIIVFPLVTLGIGFVYPEFPALPLVFKKTITLFSHLLLALPLIASLSYELLKLSDKLKRSFLIKIFIAPGLLLQKITTREPDEDQLEVALVAVKAVV